MQQDKGLQDHYSHGKLLDVIRASISELGISEENLTIEDLAPVDEFHIGGRAATENFLGQLGITAADHMLDIGCGLGGASRFAATNYNNRITGIDLTTEYIETGNTLCAWVNLDKQITLHQGSALAMPFQDEAFDGGYMMHVGMNIEDKAQLFKEIYRVLRPGSTFGVYDVMLTGDVALAFPVPWATSSSNSHLATPARYRDLILDAGFEVTDEHNRRDFALEFFIALHAKTAASNGPPPLSLHILMGDSTAVKIKNMIENITTNTISPVEMIAHKR